MTLLDLSLLIGIFILLLAFGELILMAVLDLYVWWKERR